MKLVRKIALIVGIAVVSSVVLFFMFVPVKFSWSLKDDERALARQVDEMTFTQMMSDFKAGNFEKALFGVNKLLSDRPNDPVLHSYRAVAFSGMGDHKSAIYDFGVAIGKQKNSKSLFMDLYRRGDEYLADGQYEKAYEDFIRARECDPEVWPFGVEERAARSLFKAGRYEQSKDICSKCVATPGIERNSSEGVLHYIRGKAYQKLGTQTEYEQELNWIEKKKYKPSKWESL